MTLAHIFKRPGVYLGSGFSTIDEFAKFIAACGLFADGSVLPTEEQVALRSFNEFVCRFLHGTFKNCSWERDLLLRFGNHEMAVKAAMILFLEFSVMLRRKESGQVSEILDLAPFVKDITPIGLPERLDGLIANAISMHST